MKNEIMTVASERDESERQRENERNKAEQGKRDRGGGQTNKETNG